MKKIISLSILTALLATLTGCGVKGALYFPAENQTATEEQTQTQ